MATPQTVSFHTLGCKLNFSESSSIRRTFEASGYQSVPFESGADIYVINTCSVTDFADRKCRKIVRQALRNRPNAKIIVIGCYAQLKPMEIANIEGVDLVLGAAEKFNIINYIDNLQKTDGRAMIKSGDIQDVNQFNESFSYGDRTRTFLKIQDGCDYKCSFCTIPLARGKSRSNSIESVLENVEMISALGNKEIVLTGVNIGDFKTQDGESFLDLIRALDKVKGIERFRISSIEPNLCSNEIIDFVADSSLFVPHFHMPLQSGSNKILSSMRRRYKRELYEDRVLYIKEKMPEACIGVDVIVGFPGESDDDFNETYQFLESLPISYLHVFTYSERPNTYAEGLRPIVSMDIRRKRNEILRKLSEQKRRQFYSSHFETTKKVLFEAHSSTEKMQGFTENYIKVEAPLIIDFLNTVQNVKLNSIGGNGIYQVAAECLIV